MSNVVIYSLRDPLTNDIRYVGKSTQPKERLKAHLADTSNSPKAQWIKSLLERGLSPLMETLDRCNDDDWPEYERYWIAYGRDNGWPLTNVNDGGEGVKKPYSYEFIKRYAIGKDNRKAFLALPIEKRKDIYDLFAPRVIEMIDEHIATGAENCGAVLLFVRQTVNNCITKSA